MAKTSTKTKEVKVVPVITQEESDRFVKLSAAIKVDEKEKKLLGDSLKERLQKGAAIPEGSQVMLKYSAPDFPTLSWRDIAYHMAIQIIQLKAQMPPKIAKAVEIHAQSTDASETEKIQAETMLTLIEAENPMAPRPTLSTEVNANWEKLTEA